MEPLSVEQKKKNLNDNNSIVFTIKTNYFLDFINYSLQIIKKKKKRPK